MVGRRARSDTDKALRRAAIVDAAGEHVDAVGVDEFTMDAVAATLQLAKGTLYRYFPTREALLLEVLRVRFDDWFDHVDHALPQAATGSDGAAEGEPHATLAAELVDSLLARQPLMTLLSVMPSVIERNVPYPLAAAYKTHLINRAAATGEVIERVLDSPRGTGAQLLVHLHASVVGLFHAAHPSPTIAAVLADEQFAAVRVDLRRELHHLVTALADAACR